jgi:diguanylate cyclase (GGDEF)-like protein/PAS domain S-box-containing protein
LVKKVFSAVNKFGFDVSDLQTLASGVFELSTEPMFILDSLGRVLLANSAFCQMTGYTASYLSGKNLGFLFSGYDDSDAAVQSFLTELMKDSYWHGRIICRTVSGGLIHMDAKFSEVLNAATLNRFFFGVCNILNRSVSDTANTVVDGVAFNPNLDSLTGSLNLSSFVYRLDYAIRMSEKHQNPLSIFLIDIDNFRSLNDNYGYVVGDKVIKKIALELEKFLGKADCMARIKDDKFLLMFSDIKNQKQIELKAYEIFSFFQQKGLFGSSINIVPFTMAVSSYPGGGANASELIQSAIEVIVKGKDNGGNQILYANLLDK